MKNNTILITILFILFALPIPLSLMSWIGTIISIANIGMSDWGKEGVSMIIAIATMVMAGTYLITYIVSTIITVKKKALSFFSLLPLIHIFLFVILYFTWEWLETINNI